MTAGFDASRTGLGPPDPEARRRLGRGLLVFGVAGLVLLMASAWLALGSLGAVGSAAADLETQRAQLVALLPRAEAALRGSATTATNASVSLQSSSTAARDAADLVTQLATTMDGMANAALVNVLGVQPFASLADDLAAVAAKSRTVATDLQSTATSLDTNVSDSRQAATDLGALADELAALRAAVDEDISAPADGGGVGTSVGVARIVLVGLLLWLAVPAAGATWLGWRWARG